MDLFSKTSYLTWTILQSSNFWKLPIYQNLILRLNAHRNKLLYTRIWLRFLFGWLNWVGLILLVNIFPLMILSTALYWSLCASVSHMDLFSTRSYLKLTTLQSSHFWQLLTKQNLIIQFNAHRNKLLYIKIWLFFFVGWLNWAVLVFLIKYLSFHDTYYSLGMVTLCKHYKYLIIWEFIKIAIWYLILKSMNSLTLLQLT